jgi:hypothetical protein
MYSIKSKKGMKFNKLTHLSIIVVLAIVFIVVYLYYTISDVKKIHSEVSKLSLDITKMNSSISNITNTLTAMLEPQPSATCAVGAVGAVGAISAGVCSIGGVDSKPQHPSVQDGGDDESSVNAQELQAIIETIEDEDKEQEQEPEQAQAQADDVMLMKEEPKQFVIYENDVANLDDLKDVEEMMAQQPQTLKDATKLLDITTIGTSTEDLSKLSLDALKSVAYETIRKYCKNNGLNYKGSKDVLIYRIKGVTA